MYDYGARMYMPDLGRWGTQDDLSELQLHYSPYSYVFNNPIFFNDPTGMIGESFGNGEDPKKKEKEGPVKTIEIPEIIITKYNAFKSKANDVLMFVAPIIPSTKEEMAWHTARYGKYGNGVLSDLKIVGSMIVDVPNLLSESFNSILEIEDPEEIIAVTAITLVNLKKGKVGNIAKMGNFGGKFMKLAKLFRLNINSPTTMSILENLDKPVQEFISTYRKGSIKAVFPGEHLHSTVKEVLQNNDKAAKTARKLLIDGRFLK
ncbi:hypothetical protein C1634_018085 [Chryseobacterium viscerum]|uniref:RHS repeat-associated core domain-containing protein n=1 Tax=Chryseobacterium viscerum TaxID=1037377 RepID=A0A316WL80_9FLAO|nr:hypothetical protein C1634_018085 [Chryseobacterium viscerum]